ncbi:hypothetical protein D3C85_1619920 [compost metagenome]
MRRANTDQAARRVAMLVAILADTVLVDKRNLGLEVRQALDVLGLDARLIPNFADQSRAAVDIRNQLEDPRLL